MLTTRLRTAARVLASVLFIAAGANHFLHPAIYERITPPALPQRSALVWISGIFEVVGGIGLLVHPLRRAASWGLILLLLAVFPANIYMAVCADHFSDLTVKPWALWARLPLQPLLIVWVWWVGQE